ncbi:MAG TPA: hypothetical protein VF360_08380, partial [Candidatus Methanoperedens sp.]
SSNIVRQYGQQTQTVHGSFFKASSTRATFMRVPSLSSIHILPQPAAQQNDFSRRHSISEGARPVTEAITSRGAYPLNPSRPSQMSRNLTNFNYNGISIIY